VIISGDVLFASLSIKCSTLHCIHVKVNTPFVLFYTNSLLKKKSFVSKYEIIDAVFGIFNKNYKILKL